MAVIVKWDVAAMVAAGLVLLGIWIAYAFRTGKLSVDPIMRHREHEPLARSNFVSTLSFGIIRCCIALYIIIVWCMGLSNSPPQKYFSFYTVWNYTILMIYFISVSIITLVTALTKNGISQYSTAANVWRVATWILFMAECALALLVDATVWTILYESADESGKKGLVQFDSINMHVLNFVFLIFDMFLNCIPIKFHFGFIVVIMALTYGVFSWIYYDFAKVWRYFFINSEKEIDGLWYLLVFTMHLISWSVVYLISKWKTQNFTNSRRMSDIDKLLNAKGRVDYVSVNDSSDKTSQHHPQIETSVQGRTALGDL